MSMVAESELVNEYGATDITYEHGVITGFEWSSEAVEFNSEETAHHLVGPFTFRLMGTQDKWAVTWVDRWDIKRTSTVHLPYTFMDMIHNTHSEAFSAGFWSKSS